MSALARYDLGYRSFDAGSATYCRNVPDVVRVAGGGYVRVADVATLLAPITEEEWAWRSERGWLGSAEAYDEILAMRLAKAGLR